jgi:hypothetical protein
MSNARNKEERRALLLRVKELDAIKPTLAMNLSRGLDPKAEASK